ncbi:hypothetical protein DFH28DRAFT_948258 [Melampsora americana]|nr:hypothetical protein DFH28DRAFT_948258 [Melampsora americana]
MKVLRRSLHKEKDRFSPSRQSFSPSQPSFGASILSSQHPPPPTLTKPISANSIPNSRAPTGPPTMVIRAISNYKAKRIVEISFQKGDFFHVVGEREDSEGDWFEASNPATGSRGLVPRFAFEIFGKPPSQSNHQHTPRHSEFNHHQNQAHQHHRSLNQSISLTPQPLSAGPKSAGSNGQKSQPLYGVVQHDFVAERPDELDAKRGEPIIVIAQSNHEWFVAKPIGRLGGPGLIPVSFVEVQDLTSGKALPPDRVKELIKSAVVPKVEEWKKATAAYKGNSIPLGRFDFVPDSSSPSTPHSSNRPFSNDGQSQHMSSRSVSATHSRQQSFGVNQSQPTHSGRSSQQTSYPPHSREPSNSVAAWQQQQQHQRHQSIGQRSIPSEAQYDLEEDQEGSNPEGDGYATVDELRERYGVVVHASVESFHHEQEHFWFHLRAHFSRTSSNESMPNETTVLVLYRLYEDFHDFHLALVEMFPEERLPEMPEVIEQVDELVCAKRVEDLTVYLEELCRMPEEIRECELVYEFLGPREGDVELEGEVGGGGIEMSLNRSQEDVEGEVVEYLSKMNHQERNLEDLMNGLTTRDEENGMREMEDRKIEHKESFLSIKTADSGTVSHPYKNQHQHTTSIDSRTEINPATILANKNPTGLGVTIGSLQNHSNQPTGNFLRIKIYQIETDDLIAIRVPTETNYEELLRRVKERIGEQIHQLRFKDESGIGFSTGNTLPIFNSAGNRLVGIDNDSDLERWIGSGNKLVLYVN